MKKVLLFAVVLSIFLPTMVMAKSLAWNRNNMEADLAGYNAYDTTATRTKMNTSLITTSACTGIPPAGSCTFVIPTTFHINGHTYVMTAVDTQGNESADSNTVTMDLNPPAAPGSLIIINP
jgi:hypothetical protein